jgi:hypothetical protein
MIEFIVPFYNLLQHFTNHYLRLDTLDFRPQYTIIRLLPSSGSRRLNIQELEHWLNLSANSPGWANERQEMCLNEFKEFKY